ncbi:MauE/DoxX family redox-associated membrane protein [Cohnella terricola]|nr:MauE/DoxX family redox-associated membrane protein [Cohnella terricola]
MLDRLNGSVALIAYAANLLAGATFMMSAATKWNNPENFALFLSRFSWPIANGGIRLLAYGVIFAESLLAASFALNLANGYRQGAAVFALAAFTFFLIRNRKELADTGCACFGERSRLNRFPIARNLALIVIIMVPFALGITLTPHQSAIQGTIFVVAAMIGYGLGKLVKQHDPAIPPDAGELPLLFLSYRSSGFKEADELLSAPSSREVFVMLDAPPWILETKRNRWSSHRLIAADGPIPDDAPFVMHRNRRGRLKRFGEWAAFLRQYIGEEM